MMVQRPATAKPPHHLTFQLEVIVFTRLASHIYDLSLQSREGESYFLGRIEQKSSNLWAVTYVGCQPCMPDYFDDWHQATLFLLKFKV